MPTTTISIPAELKVLLKKHKYRFNVSSVCQTALSDRVHEFEVMDFLREEHRRRLDSQPPRIGVGTFRPRLCVPLTRDYEPRWFPHPLDTALTPTQKSELARIEKREVG